MWVSEDGRLNTAAIPAEYVRELPGVRGFDPPDVGRLITWDPWRDGGLGDAIVAEAEASFLGSSPGEEVLFRGEPVPDDILMQFPWFDVVDSESAEAALRAVPLRWRLDMAHVLEDLISDLAEGTAAH